MAPTIRRTRARHPQPVRLQGNIFLNIRVSGWLVLLWEPQSGCYDDEQQKLPKEMGVEIYPGAGVEIVCTLLMHASDNGCKAL